MTLAVPDPDSRDRARTPSPRSSRAACRPTTATSCSRAPPRWPRTAASTSTAASTRRTPPRARSSFTRRARRRHDVRLCGTAWTRSARWARSRSPRATAPRRPRRSSTRPVGHHGGRTDLSRRPRAAAGHVAHRGRHGRVRGQRDERRCRPHRHDAEPGPVQRGRPPERHDRGRHRVQPGRTRRHPARSLDREAERKPLAHEQRRLGDPRRSREAQRRGLARDRRATPCASPTSPRSTSR